VGAVAAPGQPLRFVGVLASMPSNGASLDIALAGVSVAGDQGVVAWSERSLIVRYTTFNARGRSAPATTLTASGGPSVLAHNAAGQAILAWSASAVGSPTAIRYAILDPASGRFAATQTVPGGPYLTGAPDPAVGTDGRIGLSWSQQATDEPSTPPGVYTSLQGTTASELGPVQHISQLASDQAASTDLALATDAQAAEAIKITTEPEDASGTATAPTTTAAQVTSAAAGEPFAAPVALLPAGSFTTDLRAAPFAGGFLFAAMNTVPGPSLYGQVLLTSTPGTSQPQAISDQQTELRSLLLASDGQTAIAAWIERGASPAPGSEYGELHLLARIIRQ
jgi:hypothetical protein